MASKIEMSNNKEDHSGLLTLEAGSMNDADRSEKAHKEGEDNDEDLLKIKRLIADPELGETGVEEVAPPQSEKKQPTEEPPGVMRPTTKPDKGGPEGELKINVDSDMAAVKRLIADPDGSDRTHDEDPSNGPDLLLQDRDLAAVDESQGQDEMTRTNDADTDSSCLSPPFARNTNIPSRPGAFGGSPGEGFRQQSPPCFKSLERSAIGAESVARSLGTAGPTDTITTLEDSSRLQHPIQRQQPTSSKRLVVALPVTGESDRDLPMAQELQGLANRGDIMEEEKRRRLKVFLFFAVALVACIIIMSVIFARKNGNTRVDSSLPLTSNANGAPTFAPTLSPTAYVQSLLPDYSLRSMDRDIKAPQSLAFAWVVKDPYLSDYPEWRIQQRYALATFYYATDGENWNQHHDWLSYDVHECRWYHSSPVLQEDMSITNIRDSDYFEVSTMSNYSNPCEEGGLDDIQEGRYKHLWQSGNGVNGTIPTEFFGILTSLKTFTLMPDFTGVVDGNISMIRNLKGTLPTEIGLCTDLEVVLFDYHSLSGPLPSEIGRLTALQVLSLSENSFSGEIPTEIGQLGNVKKLDTGRNPFSGRIPSELGRLSSISRFLLYDNLFSGTIPNELRQLSTMQQFVFKGKTKLGWLSFAERFSPSRFCSSSKSKGSTVTGTIPTWIGEMRNLTTISWGVTQLSGSVPTAIGLLSNLEIISFSNAPKLQGPIPSEFGLLSSLFILSLYHTRFTGTIPTEVGQMSMMMDLRLYNTAVTGTVPSELGQLSSMRLLRLNDARGLTGTLPLSLSSLAINGSLTVVQIANTTLSGTIPTELCNITDPDFGRGLQFDCGPLLCGCSCAC